MFKKTFYKAFETTIEFEKSDDKKKKNYNNRKTKTIFFLVVGKNC